MSLLLITALAVDANGLQLRTTSAFLHLSCKNASSSPVILGKWPGRTVFLSESFSEAERRKGISTRSPVSHHNVVVLWTEGSFGSYISDSLSHVFGIISYRSCGGREVRMRAQETRTAALTPLGHQTVLGFCFPVCNVRGGQYCLQKHF